MASNINTANPVQGNPTTASVRANFAAAKAEIEALQAAVAANSSSLVNTVITGTTPAVQGGDASFAHNLNPAKIMSVSILIEIGANNFVKDEYDRSPGYRISLITGPANITIICVATLSANVIGKPFRILVQSLP